MDLAAPAAGAWIASVVAERRQQRCLQFPRRGDRNAGRKYDHMVGDVGNAGNADDVTLRLMTENSL